MSPKDAYEHFFDSTDYPLLQLATVNDKGELWACSVYAVREGHDLYWRSSKTERHSSDVATNGRVAATFVYDAKNKRAIQMSGRAVKLPADSSSDHAHGLYEAKFGNQDGYLEEVMSGRREAVAYYKLMPDKIHLWDEQDYPSEPKQIIM